MVPLLPVTLVQDPEEKVDTWDEVPKEFEIYARKEEDFLPEGKTFADLTPEEENRLRNRYRFDPYRPGQYQSLSGMGYMSRG